jgi:hypothetical protein
MRAFGLSAALIIALAAPAFAAQPADGVYACVRGDAALGDIEITGTTFRTRAPGADFVDGGEYLPLEDGESLFWLGDPAIVSSDTISIDNTKVVDGGFDITILDDDATDFETVACRG